MAPFCRTLNDGRRRISLLYKAYEKKRILDTAERLIGALEGDLSDALRESLDESRALVNECFAAIRAQ